MEAFPAELAHERLVARVDARVRVERGAAVEGFPALVTFVRFFLRHNKEDSCQSGCAESGRTVLSAGTVHLPPARLLTPEVGSRKTRNKEAAATNTRTRGRFGPLAGAAGRAAEPAAPLRPGGGAGGGRGGVGVRLLPR